MKRVFLLLVLVVIVMTNSFAQARKVMCTEETMFVEEYVVDSLLPRTIPSLRIGCWSLFTTFCQKMLFSF